MRETPLNVLDFMRVGDSNHAAAIHRVNEAATTQAKAVWFPAGSYRVGTESFDIDGGRTQWFSDGLAYLDWTNETPDNGYGIRIIDSNASYAGSNMKIRTVLRGFSLIGGYESNNITGVALKIEGDAENITHHVYVRDVSIKAFSTAIEYTDNVWFIGLDNVYTVWGNIVTPETTTNFGESMSLNNCMFADGAGFTFNRGTWKAINTSFDNFKITVNNDSVVRVIGGHLENPVSSSTTAVYGEINGEGLLYLLGTEFVHNTPSGGPKTVPFFEVNTDPTKPIGLVLDGVRGVAWTPENYNTLAAENHYVMASGGGRVIAKNMSFSAWANGYKTAIGKGAQRLQNGTFEGSGSGSTAGWRQHYTSGGDATYAFEATADEHYTGSYALKIATTIGTGGSVYQEVVCSKVRCKCGDIAVGGLWLKSDFSAGTGSIQTSLRFINGDGTTIEKYSWSQETGTGDWEYKRLGYVAPDGAEDVVILIYVASTSGTVTAYIDEVLLNVIDN